MQRNHAAERGASTCQFENAAASDTVTNGRDPILVAFWPATKLLNTRKKAPAKLGSLRKDPTTNAA